MSLILRGRTWLICLFLAASPTAWAHHSTASYDYKRSLTLEGTVKEFQWTNPHMYIELLVPNAQGKTMEWNIECGTPNINVRHGWQYDDIKTGDHVRVLVHPKRDGTMEATADTVWTADGKKLYAPGHDLVAGKVKG